MKKLACVFHKKCQETSKHDILYSIPRELKFAKTKQIYLINKHKTEIITHREKLHEIVYSFCRKYDFLQFL